MGSFLDGPGKSPYEASQFFFEDNQWPADPPNTNALFAETFRVRFFMKEKLVLIFIFTFTISKLFSNIFPTQTSIKMKSLTEKDGRALQSANQRRSGSSRGRGWISGRRDYHVHRHVQALPPLNLQTNSLPLQGRRRARLRQEGWVQWVIKYFQFTEAFGKIETETEDWNWINRQNL